MHEDHPAPPQPHTVAVWAIVELMGHARLAGRVSPDSSLVPGLLRVDVPAAAGRGAFTKLVAPGSLYALTPCTEATARAAAARLRDRPFHVYGLEEELRGQLEHEVEVDGCDPAADPDGYA